MGKVMLMSGLLSEVCRLLFIYLRNPAHSLLFAFSFYQALPFI